MRRLCSTECVLLVAFRLLGSISINSVNIFSVLLTPAIRFLTRGIELLRATVASAPGVLIIESWILDRGATMHMIGTLDLLGNVQDYTGFATFGNNMVNETNEERRMLGIEKCYIYTSV